ncbi:MAG: rod shape-determining protein MreC [Gemmatimonadales bacterium]|jgi:rod shape-determining protein MreC
MMLAPETYSSRRDTLAFAICLLLSIAARVAPEPVRETVADVVSVTVLTPFLELQHQAEIIRASRSRFARISAVRDSALVASLTVQAVSEENERLRELLGLTRRLPGRHVAAEVLHQPGVRSGHIAVLSAGSRAGVVPQAPVVGPGGLLGVVRSVTPTQAVALLWPHPDFRVSAMTFDGTVFGIVAARGSEGPRTQLLELSGVPYGDELEPGTLVYTSGLGGAVGVYPRGIPIGTVIAVAEEREGWSRSYVVRPAVHPAAVTHVVVLRPGVDDLRGAFAPIP